MFPVIVLMLLKTVMFPHPALSYIKTTLPMFLRSWSLRNMFSTALAAGSVCLVWCCCCHIKGGKERINEVNITPSLSHEVRRIQR